jgi:REase_DpnII-MboI
MDLLLKHEQIVIETKMTRDNLGQRKVAEELAIDKEFYRSHPDCRTLVCFVYDPGRHLENPTALETDLTDQSGPIPTLVIVAPMA